MGLREIGGKRPAALLAALALTMVLSPSALAADMPEELVPVGQTVGIDIKCDGVMVVALNEVNTDTGVTAPAVDAGLAPGDVITQVGSAEITSSADFKAAIEEAGTETVTVRVVREGREMQLNLTPVRDDQGGFELGIWLRDGMAGIGTVTFYDPANGVFGALGHSVSDVETGVLMPLGEGSVMPATVKSVILGEAGIPGELQGEFDFGTTLGTLYANTPTGIFGTAEDGVFDQREALPVASADEIELGAATIISNVSGTETQEFDIEISRIFSGGDDRNMMITVTDPELISTTGGIVQGMSGSPIVQNGKIIGAVTHVLINNPEKGYGIAVESMLSQAYAGEGEQVA